MFRVVMFGAGWALCVVGAAVGAEADPMHGDACRSALAALDAQEARQAPAPPRGAAPAALQAARRAVARACLGAAEGPASAPRAAQPAFVLPTPQPLAVRRLPMAPPTPVGPPIVRPQPPAFVTACDATGCWGSDGARLDRVGPDLYYRNHQLCTARGGLLQCP